MKQLDWYILRQYLGTVLYTVVLFIIVAVVIDLSEKVDNFLEHEADFKDVIFIYYRYFIPHIVFLLSPIFIFISVIFFTSKLAGRSEIIAILSSGVSFYRILFVPYLIGATIFAGIQLYANHYVVPPANGKRIAFENEFVKKKLKSTEFGIRMQLQEGVFLGMNSYSIEKNKGKRLTLEHFENEKLRAKLLVEEVTWNDEKEIWALKNWKLRKINGLKETVSEGEKLDTIMNFTPEDFNLNEILKDAMPTPELIKRIEREELKQSSGINFYKIELQRRSAIPAATFILTLIGFSLASRKVRGGMGWHLLLGIAISSAYVLIMQFSTTLSTNAGFSPALAVWSPNILFGILAIYLMITAPK